MAFTSAELDNIANAALDFYVKGPTFKQTIQDKPLLNALIAKQETFPGGKGDISIPVQGEFDTSSFQGYTHNDTVGYTNPANIKRAEYPWKEVHAGITVTHTELKIDGLSVVDTTSGDRVSNHSERDVTVLTGLFQNKLEDMGESWARSFDEMLHLDGTQDAKQVPGIQLLIAEDPKVGTLGGLSRVTNTWWRNRSAVDLSGSGGTDNRITPSASSQTLSRFLRQEVRQLRRYGKGKYLVIAGSRFLEALDLEIYEKGKLTDAGFSSNKATDISMADVNMRGIGSFMYDPTLDDLGLESRCYFIDTSAIKLKVMQGEDRRIHTPARPHDQYVLYRAMTWTGALVARQLNTSAVYEVGTF